MPIDRKSALAQYRERKPQVGVYALRCNVTKECWLGSSATLDTIENRHRFTLTQGSHPHRGLQAAASAHGVETIAFEVVEVLPEDTPRVARERLMKDRLLHHLERLEASKL